MRVLVTAASKYGSTAGIAEAIGRRLEEHEVHVDVVPIGEVDDITRYDAIVLGSGVYAGRWLKAARRLVEAHESEFEVTPTWLFSSGPIGDPPKPEGDTAVRLDAIVRRTAARDHRIFPGKMDRRRLTFPDRAIVTAVRSPEGDFRDWPAIAAWADEIAGALALDEHSAEPAGIEPDHVFGRTT